MLRSNEEKYEASWEKLFRYKYPFYNLIALLNQYTKGWNRSHKESIKSIILPYINQTGEVTLKNTDLLSLDPQRIQYLFQQICKLIPEKDIKPEGSLAAIFKVIKNHVNIDIKTFYDKKKDTLANALDAEKNMNKVVFLLCDAGNNSYSNLFSYLPKEISLYICQLMVISTNYFEKNNGYHLFITLLEGYCGFNLSIPDKYEKLQLYPIEYFLSKHHSDVLYKTPGGLLFELLELFKFDNLDGISEKDGLTYIFNILHEYLGIDIKDCYPNTPMIDFFNRKRKVITLNNDYDCWIKMMLDNGIKFAYEDAQLLLSRPYFSTSDKNTQIEMFLTYLNNVNDKMLKFSLNCIDLIFTTHETLSNAFLLALKTYKYNAAVHLFRHANGLSMPASNEFYKYQSAMTFFSGTKDKGSSIAVLPKDAVNKIASLTMRQS